MEKKIEMFFQKNMFFQYNSFFEFQKLNIYDFYEKVFSRDGVLPFELKGKENYINGKYNSIAINIKKNNKSKIMIITSDLEELEELVDEEFVITSPITYIGRNRNSNNSRFCYGLAFDIDGVKMENLLDLLHQMNSKRLPVANIIVNSGSGVHLYYLFEKPIALFDNIKELLKKLKYNLTVELWNMYTSSIKEKQIQGIFQGFRLPDTKTKFGERVTAFEFLNQPYSTIEHLNSFIYDKKLRLKDVEVETINKALYKHSKISLKKAKELYPDWYERRIVKGEKRKSWNIKKDLYKWWFNRIKGNEVKEGHRYFCLMTLSMYAIKCRIPYKKLEKDAYSLLKNMENLTINEDNHFTLDDIKDALKAYNENYITFPRKDIEKITGIIIPKNKRNYQKQKDHLEEIRVIRDLRQKRNGTKWTDNNGRPKGSGTKENIVIKYKKKYPTATMYKCWKDTGLSKNTIRKYWHLTEKEI